MESVFLAVLFAAAVWMGDLYCASKFRHFYPKLKPGLLPKKAPKWKQTFVYRNQLIKHVSLVAFWAGWVLGMHASNIFYAVSFLGLAVYLFSRLWPTVLPKGPMSLSKPRSD